MFYNKLVDKNVWLLSKNLQNESQWQGFQCLFNSMVQDIKIRKSSLSSEETQLDSPLSSVFPNFSREIDTYKGTRRSKVIGPDWYKPLQEPTGNVLLQISPLFSQLCCCWWASAAPMPLVSQLLKIGWTCLNEFAEAALTPAWDALWFMKIGHGLQNWTP